MSWLKPIGRFLQVTVVIASAMIFLARVLLLIDSSDAGHDRDTMLGITLWSVAALVALLNELRIRRGRARREEAV